VGERKIEKFHVGAGKVERSTKTKPSVGFKMALKAGTNKFIYLYMLGVWEKSCKFLSFGPWTNLIQVPTKISQFYLFANG
jgi:hypothetical protein